MTMLDGDSDYGGTLISCSIVYLCAQADGCSGLVQGCTKAQLCKLAHLLALLALIGYKGIVLSAAAA